MVTRERWTREMSLRSAMSHDRVHHSRPTRRRRSTLAVLAVASALGLAGAGGDRAAAVDAELAGFLFELARPMVDDGEVVSASLGVTLFLLEHVSNPREIAEPCPILRIDQVNYFLGQRGFTPSGTGYTVQIVSSAGDQGLPSIECGVDIVDLFDAPDPVAPHGAFVAAMNIDGQATFAEVLAAFPGATIVASDVPVIGGEIGGRCISEAQVLCGFQWHRDGLVVTFGLVGPPADVGQDQTTQLLVEMIPAVIESLGAYGVSPPAPTTPPFPTVAPAPAPTVAPLPTVAPDPTVGPVSTVATAPVLPTAPTPTAPTPTAPTPTAPVPTLPVSTVPPLAPTAVSVPASSTPAPTAPTTSAPTTIGTPQGEPDIAAARATLADFLANNPVGTDVGTGAGIAPICPGSGVSTLPLAMAGVGLLPSVDDFRVKVEASTAAPGLLTVVCGGDVIGAIVAADAASPSHTAAIQMFDITGVATLEQVLAERDGLALAPTTVPGLGGEVYSAPCGAVDPGAFCVRLWHREGLVILVQIGGTNQAGLDASADLLLVDLVGEIVNDLATNANWPTPTGPGQLLRT